MQDSYHLWGVISSLLFMVTAYGLFHQLTIIYSRKRLASNNQLENETPCSVISTNRTFGSYFAFFGNFYLGICLPHFDWYLFITRFVALIILLLTLWEIFHERRDKWAGLLFYGSIFLMLFGMSSVFFPASYLSQLLPVAKILIVFAVIFLLQGYIHQMRLLRKFKKIGGISKKMYQTFLLKEISTLIFAFTMDLSNSWPLILQHALLLIAEIVILIEIYRIESLSNKKISDAS